MARSSQNSSSAHASHNIVQRRRRCRNSSVGKISIRFNGTANLQSSLFIVGAGPFSVRHGTSGSPRAGNINPRPPPSLRYVPSTSVNEFAGGQIPAAGQGSSSAGYHQRTQTAGHTYVPESNIDHPAPFLHTDVAGPEYLRDWRYPQPSGGLYHGRFTSAAQMNAAGQIPSVNEFAGGQIPAAGQGSSSAGYHQRTQNAGHTYVPESNIDHPAPFLHTDVAGPEYLRDWRYPQPSSGLYHGRFTSAAQMNADRPVSVTGRYNPGGPRANLTSQAYVDGPTTLQAHPSLPTYDNQAAQPPNLPTAETNGFTGELFPPATLAEQLSPHLWATAANNASAGEFLPTARAGSSSS